MGEQPTDPPGAADEIGWPRAIASGFLIVLVGFLGAVLIPNAIVRMQGLSGSGRSLLAMAVMVVAVVGLAWTLRRLQGRRII